ncbi:hypothetical protein SETIT_9G462500v2 [Setaria italica]|uniref:CCHC-type domain-containing protein n=1 Tax=Setaria italica TaxID=4555 RepID=A0A368SSX7_SETIT|nr:hypothetical protein SETIT_9G462500v2 [Setaria italica]
MDPWEQQLGEKMDVPAGSTEGSGKAEARRQDTDGLGAASQEANLDRRLIVHGGPAGEDLEEGEFEYDFEEEEPVGGAKKRWFAVARYYSSRIAKSKILFSELSNVWGDVTSRVLGDNRLSEVIIESIPLWIHMYDIPVGVMSIGFVSALGAKVGRVLEVGEAVKGFKRSQGERPNGVYGKYENVPHFCFCCGRIGHAERECLDEELYEGKARFGTKLRALPFKREVARMLSFQATVPPAKRDLNFSGTQKDKVISFSGSSSLNGGRHGRMQQHPKRQQEKEDKEADGLATEGRVEESSNSKFVVTPEVADGLANGVQKMVVDMAVPNGNIDPSVVAGCSQDAMMGFPEMVSGIDSYDGSSDGSLSIQEELMMSKTAGAPLSLHEQLLRLRLRPASPGASKDINKPKKHRSALKLEVIAKSLKEMQQGGVRSDGLHVPPGEVDMNAVSGSSGRK